MKFIILVLTFAVVIASAHRGGSGGRGGFGGFSGGRSNQRFGGGGRVPFPVNPCSGNFQFVNGTCICPPFASTVTVPLRTGGSTQQCECTTACTAGQIPVFGLNCTCQAIPSRGWGRWF
ncbi:hypothetical protein PVAND_006334 [Polypedilum vanderplanki]|uniref:Uncharacterized protein n=1 Tax=Polypedilum vanderplanki TaxID=319348 RepID=A0A9J6C3B1_POLVA|nr:hypothetical protein PVAND_006334 [Polypedilum vanderplanki]